MQTSPVSGNAPPQIAGRSGSQLENWFDPLFSPKAEMQTSPVSGMERPDL